MNSFMKKRQILRILILLPILIIFIGSVLVKSGSAPNNIISFKVNPKSVDIRFYWKDSDGQRFGSIANLKKYVEENNGELLFAMNGGMYNPDHSPQGLYIEDQVKKANLDTSSGYGNFYMKPNGVFCLSTEKNPGIITTENFVYTDSIEFATQSGPMLIINGEMHPAFREGSNSVHIRNGVGILPTGELLFAMSKEMVNFYDFANYFKKSGCLNALYLDGFVSRTYLPSKNWVQLDGDFGVIIGIVK